jgi:FtsH-binding integral membrane protein
MKEEELYQMINEKERGLNMSIAFPALMRKVFLWMSLALIITAVTAYGVATSPTLMTAIFTNKILFWGLH